MPRGRSALGAAAKSKIGSVRITPTENEHFEKKFGGLGKFLALKVREELNKRDERVSPTQVMK